MSNIDGCINLRCLWSVIGVFVGENEMMDEVMYRCRCKHPCSKIIRGGVKEGCMYVTY